MLQSSKLSNRFKKIKEEGQSTLPAKINSSDAIDFIPDEVEGVQVVQHSNFDLDIDLKKSLIEKIESIPVWFEYTAEKQKELIKSFVDNKLSEEKIALDDSKKSILFEKLFSAILGFGPLDYFIEQENVEAIFVNGTNSIHIEIDGKILNTETKLTEKQINFILNNVSKISGINIDDSKNILHCNINNLFINIIMPGVSVSGCNITIRKMADWNIASLVEKGMGSKEIFDFIISMIVAKKHIVISGDINSGKTTLLNTLINASLKNKRIALLEEFPTISAVGDALMKFIISKNSLDYSPLISDILKMVPESIFVDLNSSVPEFSDTASVTTLRASSVENAITKLVAEFAANGNVSEKLAKTKVFTDYDYIVQINKTSDGKRNITSIVELTPARTSALSIKVIAKLVDGKYVTEIPQPLTSIRADSLLSGEGLMSSRFYH